MKRYAAVSLLQPKHRASIQLWIDRVGRYSRSGTGDLTRPAPHVLLFYNEYTCPPYLVRQSCFSAIISTPARDARRARDGEVYPVAKRFVVLVASRGTISVFIAYFNVLLICACADKRGHPEHQWVQQEDEASSTEFSLLHHYKRSVITGIDVFTYLANECFLLDGLWLGRLVITHLPLPSLVLGVSNHPEGLIAPGMHVTCTVTFTPPSLCNYQEEIKVCVQLQSSQDT